MRSTQLLTIAAQAETIRLQRKAAAFAQRLVFTIAGAVFIVCALGFGEYAGYRALTIKMEPPAAALIAAAANMAIAALFLVLAAHKKRDRLSVEAKLVRNNAMRELQDSLSFGLLLKRIFGSMGANSMSSVALASMVAKFLGRFRVLIVVLGCGLAMANAPPALAAGTKNPQTIAQQTPAAPPVPSVSPQTNQTPSIGAQHRTNAVPEQVGNGGQHTGVSTPVTQ